MFHTSTTRTAARAVGAGALVLVAGAGTTAWGGSSDAAAGGVDRETARVGVVDRVAEDPSNGCVFDPRYLPHTPDAVEGWYRSCLFGGDPVTECELDPRYLPHTPDAVEGWYRSCERGR